MRHLVPGRSSDSGSIYSWPSPLQVSPDNHALRSSRTDHRRRPAYHNGICRPLKDDIARLTGATANLKNEEGLEVFYDFVITPAIRVIPSYQHVWNPLTAAVVRNERGADVFLVRLSLTW